MSWFEAIVLGIVQGLTEFLPISSTGHVRVVPALFGWEDPGAAFSAVIQLGTMAAVLIYFRRDILMITSSWVRGIFDREVRRTRESLLGWYIALGTIPVIIVGVLFADQIETTLRSLYVVAGALIIGGVIMLLVERFARRERGIESVTRNDAIAVGIAQALALIPGVSRSGSTIVGGLLMGLNREAAARFSFLLSVPAVVLSGVYQVKDIGEGGAPIGMTVVAALCAFVSGYAAIAFLLRYLARHSLALFAFYRFGFGALIIALAATGAIS